MQSEFAEIFPATSTKDLLERINKYYIKQEWIRISLDLQMLIADGNLNNEMSLKEAIHTLEQGPQ